MTQQEDIHLFGGCSFLDGYANHILSTGVMFSHLTLLLQLLLKYCE